MKKLAKVFYTINSITCIFIGLIHGHAHFNDLVTHEVQIFLDHNILVTGIEANIYHLWQGMSLMMSVLLIFVGILHLFILYKTDKNSYPPIGGSIIMILMLLCIMYVWYLHQGPWQVYGGLGGIILQGSCLVLSIRGRGSF